MDVVQIKVVILGDVNVGKSSLLYRFITGEFKEGLDPTVGASFLGKLVRVGGKSVKFNIWDTAGQERYNSFARMYCRDANAVIFVFEAGDEESFQGLEKWNRLVSDSNIEPNAKVYIVSNKSDLHEYTQVPETIQNFASQLEGKFFQVSAKHNTTITELFETIAQDAVQAKQPTRKFSLVPAKHSSLKIEVKKKKCC